MRRIFIICLIFILSLSLISCNTDENDKPDVSSADEINEISKLFEKTAEHINSYIEKLGDENVQRVEISDVSTENMYKVYAKTHYIFDEDLHGDEVKEYLKDVGYVWMLDIAVGDSVYSVEFVKRTLQDESEKWMISTYGINEAESPAIEILREYREKFKSSDDIYFVQVGEFASIIAIVVTDSGNYFRLFSNTHANRQPLDFDYSSEFISEAVFMKEFRAMRESAGYPGPEDTVY